MRFSHFVIDTINNGNRTERSSIGSVIIRVFFLIKTQEIPRVFLLAVKKAI